MERGKPAAEALIEGELSPFEHEALYQLLRKKFSIEQPSYVELPDETLATRINITFHHPYTSDFFARVLQEDWRELKGLLKEVRNRRGKAGAAFNLTFIEGKARVVFKSGLLNSEQMSSALDQVGHLTGIVRQMTRPGMIAEPLVLLECAFDGKSDRWQNFQGTTLSEEKRVYVFDDNASKWTRTEN